jgi:AI-2 transport protein TqsA
VRSPRQRWERERKLQTICLLIITTCMLGAVAYWMSTVLIPFVLALFIFQLLDPAVNWLTLRCRLPHALAVSVTLALTVLAILATSSIFTTSIGQLIGSSDAYVKQLLSFLEEISARFPVVGERFRVLSQTQFEQFSTGIGTFIATLTNSIIYVLSQSTVVVLFLMFLLFGSRSHYEPLPGVLDDINKKVKKYIQVKTALSVANGVLAGAILWLLDIELALVFGLMTVVLNFIPNVGSIIATVLPIPIILVSPDVSRSEAVLAVVIPGIIHFFVGNVLEPQLLGDTMDLSPVVVLLSLTVWTALWGGIGALLAVPITAVIQILCEKLDFTRPISEVLRGNFLDLFEQPKPGTVAATLAVESQGEDTIVSLEIDVEGTPA